MVSHLVGGDPYRLVRRYRRLAEPVVRGRTGIAVTVVVFFVASGIGHRTGVGIVAVWLLVAGTYCSANFVGCREAHCVVTGAGWSTLALLALAAAAAPGDALVWLRVDVLTVAFLAILGAGYGFEAVMAARTGRHVLGVGKDGAEAR